MKNSDSEVCNVTSQLYYTNAVHKFTRAGLITGTDWNRLLLFLLQAQFLVISILVYMYRLIPGPISMIYIFSLKQ